MKIKSHIVKNTKIAEIISEEVLLTTINDALDLIGNLSHQGFDKIIIHAKNITPDFFNLKTQIAGNILQKFIQYQMPVLIVGDFSKLESKSLNDFIFESNKGRAINFAPSVSSWLS